MYGSLFVTVTDIFCAKFLMHVTYAQRSRLILLYVLSLVVSRLLAALLIMHLPVNVQWT